MADPRVVTCDSVFDRADSSAMSRANTAPARNALLFAVSAAGTFSYKWTSRSGLLNGSGLRTTACMTLKIAVLAPMPSASVRTMSAVRPRAFHRPRHA